VVEACGDAVAGLSDDYTYVIGEVNGDYAAGSGYRWVINGEIVEGGKIAELLYLSFAKGTEGAAGEIPLESRV